MCKQEVRCETGVKTHMPAHTHTHPYLQRTDVICLVCHDCRVSLEGSVVANTEYPVSCIPETCHLLMPRVDLLIRDICYTPRMFRLFTTVQLLLIILHLSYELHQIELSHCPYIGLFVCLCLWSCLSVCILIRLFVSQTVCDL